MLVADGYKQSFDNVLGFHGVRQHLEAEIISEILACEKPDQRMFEAALAALDIDATDAGSVVMIGNHLGRDINGANRTGHHQHLAELVAAARKAGIGSRRGS